MSQESLEWLNRNVLVGFTDKRGNAWHHKASEQGSEPNHYAGAIPVEDVRRRLFAWHAVVRPLYIAVPAGLDDATAFGPDGNPVRYIEQPDRKAICADDNNDVLGLFKSGYEIHQYDDWLVDNIGTILDGELGIGSAGLLQNRGQAWVQVEVPESIVTPEGVEFRPNLTACTSLNGTLVTTYKRMVQVAVCDNTLAAGLSEKGQQYKVKHTKYSGMQIASAREALAIVYDTADDFSAEVKKLCEQTVTDGQWGRLLDSLMKVDDSVKLSKATETRRERKRSDIERLYNYDERAATWKGTAFGVLQAFNTYTTHVQSVRGGNRVERNMGDVLDGTAAKVDSGVLAALARVQNKELVAV